MRKNYIREKRIQCGSEYMAVAIYPITPTEHKARRKKEKASSERQKAANKMASMRRRQRKALANFSNEGFFVTGTYSDDYLPEDFAACCKDVRNYKRRIMQATQKRFGVAAESIRLMFAAVQKGEGGRMHMHGFAECVGLTRQQRREWREMLEDLWRRRIEGTREFEPLGTLNADRIDMRKILGKDGTGGTVSYFYAHKKRTWIETRNLIQPKEEKPNDTTWSRKQLRTATGDMANDTYWWGQRYPGYALEKCTVYEPRELHETPTAERRQDGWEMTEAQCYVILRRIAKART